MSVTIADHTFSVVHYDADGDVLYLHKRSPDGAVKFYDTPEGHAVRLGPSGALVGVTIINAKWLLERDGKIQITLPQHVEVSADSLDQALTAA